ncbi:hypothetical protein [Aureimonas sp. AU4]|uniref:hypothetical protein n=1 Tax=Aureimonas sp. AU4 TaxID=1638163 RepID=UPI000782DDAA|nr:hypothetical protein [Aureimonas sp. AU4]
MDLTDTERAFLRGMRAITLHADGYEVFVGLSSSESDEYLVLSRRNEAGEDMSGSERFLFLNGLHETHRQSIVLGQASMDPPSTPR